LPASALVLPLDIRDSRYSTCCHTFRATGITTYLENGGTLEHAQTIAKHESPRTTKLYDRTREELTAEEIGRIRLSFPASSGAVAVCLKVMEVFGVLFDRAYKESGPCHEINTCEPNRRRSRVYVTNSVRADRQGPIIWKL
jgi:cytochrome c biogenesis protein ResB